MSTATAPIKGTRLTWDEIHARYPDAWVVIVDADWAEDGAFEFGSAEVIAHHKRRKDASPDMKATLAGGREACCFWTGEIRVRMPAFLS